MGSSRAVERASVRARDGDEEAEGQRGREAERLRDTRDTETQRHRDTRTQRLRDTRDSETQRFRDTETQRHRDTEKHFRAV